MKPEAIMLVDKRRYFCEEIEGLQFSGSERKWLYHNCSPQAEDTNVCYYLRKKFIGRYEWPVE